MKLAKTVVLAALAATGASAQANLGAQKPEPSLPFGMTKVATLNLPWRLAFLPDGRMLITEKVGPIWLVTQTGEKTPVANAPPVLAQGQGGMLGVFLSLRRGPLRLPHLCRARRRWLQLSAGTGKARAR
jgi:aldose sugar dehydrogenase